MPPILRCVLLGAAALALLGASVVPAAQAHHRWGEDGYEYWAPPRGEDDGDWGEPGRAPAPPELPPKPEIVDAPPTVKGKRALLRRNGKAAIPRGAPKRVRAILAAGNRIAGKPYKWGGGHRRINDRGYDCSGAVSFALIKPGLLRSPMVSGSFARWGTKGRGRWVTIYANKRHVYMEVAGLRLDTSAVGDWQRGRKGVRWRPVIGRRKGFAARRIPGL